MGNPILEFVNPKTRLDSQNRIVWHRMVFSLDFGKVIRGSAKKSSCFWTTRFVTENKMDDHRSGRDDRKHNSYALVLSELYRVTYAN